MELPWLSSERKVFFVKFWFTVLESFLLLKIAICMGVDVNCFIKLLKCSHSPRMLISLFCIDIFSLVLRCLGFFPLILGVGKESGFDPLFLI